MAKKSTDRHIGYKHDPRELDPKKIAPMSREESRRFEKMPRLESKFEELPRRKRKMIGPLKKETRSLSQGKGRRVPKAAADRPGKRWMEDGDDARFISAKKGAKRGKGKSAKIVGSKRVISKR